MSEKNEELDLAKVQEEQFTEEAATVKAPEVSKDAGKSDMEIVKAARKKVMTISVTIHSICALIVGVIFYTVITPPIRKSCKNSTDFLCAISQQFWSLIGLLLLANIAGVVIASLCWPKDMETRVNDPEAKIKCSKKGVIAALFGTNIAIGIIFFIILVL